MRLPFLSAAAAVSVVAFAAPAFATTGCNAEGWEEDWFSDVQGCHSYYPAIKYVKERGIVEGYADGTYKPEDPINRAEFVKILFGVVFPEGTGDHCGASPTIKYFSDVDYLHSWYGYDVCLMAEHEIIDGYPDGTFKPGNLINYAEAAKIVANAYELPPEQAEDFFEEGDDIWFLPYTNALLKKHVVPPTVGRFAQNLTRGEMAEMIYRFETGKTSTEWFASLLDGSIVDSLTVTDNVPDVEFSYDGSLFTGTEGAIGMRDVYARDEWRVVPGFNLTYVRNDEESMQCDGMSGRLELCRTVYSMLDMSIGVVDRPMTYIRMGVDSSFDENAHETIVDGRAGVSIYDGIECEGDEYTLVPMDSRRTLVIHRAIDCNEHPEGYLTSEEQNALFRSFLDTIDITVPAAPQSAPLMEVTMLLCPYTYDATVQTDIPTVTVRQTVPKSSAIADQTLQALFSVGYMSDAQSCDGMSWMGGHYRGVTIVGGVATVKLNATFEEIFHNVDEKEKELYKISVQRSISANLKQFPSVKDVRYVVER